MSRTGWTADDARAVDYFTTLVDRHGIDVRSLDWGSKESQARRFKVLSEVAPTRGRSVLDIGCGLGDFYEYLKASGGDVRYTGVDLTPRMIEVARGRFPEAQFATGNVLAPDGPPLEPHDLVVASGIFFCRLSEPVEFVQTMVRRMFDLATVAVAFNSLSAWSGQVDADEFYADPLATLEFCRSLTPRVALRHDYHPRDFTIYMYREGFP